MNTTTKPYRAERLARGLAATVHARPKHERCYNDVRYRAADLRERLRARAERDGVAAEVDALLAAVRRDREAAEFERLLAVRERDRESGDWWLSDDRRARTEAERREERLRELAAKLGPEFAARLEGRRAL